MKIVCLKFNERIDIDIKFKENLQQPAYFFHIL